MSLHPWNRDLWQELTGDRARLPHALLLYGPKGIGKREFAADLAQWLLCESPGPDGACGHCKACGWYEQGAHPDFKLVEPAAESAREDEPGKKGGKFITINEIRSLGDFLGLVSHQGGWRVVVVQPAELLNAAAANALLKTLEEPPANVLIVLVAHQPRRLPATVRSRCRKLAVGLPASEQARAWLAEQGMQAPMAILDEVGGAPLLAIECAEPERLARRSRFLAVLAKPTAEGLSRLAQESQQRVEECWGWLTRWLYDLLVIQANGQTRYFPDSDQALRKLAARASPASLWQCQQELIAAGRWLRHPLNGQLLLESWLLLYLDALETKHGR
ncbi:MAG: DNA polymerase III subunit delta' [Gallionellaceae bacterium]|nr:DNA polymerase III subunit delta' [Gallionellaceae bacterium]